MCCVWASYGGGLCAVYGLAMVREVGRPLQVRAVRSKRPSWGKTKVRLTPP